MKLIFAIAIGGALGAVGRYVVSVLMLQWISSNIPLGTLVVNVVGSFVLGLVYECGTLVWQSSNEFKAFLIVGILGGFTTFSTFSLEIVVLFQKGEIGAGVLYAIGSLVLAVLGLTMGIIFGRSIFA